MDGGLDAAGVAAAEAHASTCERCQALLATVTKTLPTDDLAARPTGARGTFWKWWLAPLAATAAAVTIWMVVPQTPMQSPVQPPASAPARDTAADTPAKRPAPAEPEAPTSPAKAAPSPGSLADSRR